MAPARDSAGIVAAEVARLVSELHPEVQRKCATFAGHIAGEVVEAFISLSEEKQKLAAENSRALARDIVAWMIGAGKVERESAEETRGAEPWYVEEWAGAVAGPTQLEAQFGISRSTLYRWQKLGLVIALPKGRRRHVFPLEQFIDGRPVDGIEEVLQHFGDARRAWKWLVSECDRLDDERPIDWLRRSATRRVAEALQ